MTAPSGTGKTPIPKPSSESEPFQMDDGHSVTVQTPEISLYEQSRELRIKENLERMQKLGIVDLSLKLKSSIPPKRNYRKSLNRKSSPASYEIPQAGPRRRSSRLQNATPVNYSEVQTANKNKSSETEDLVLEEGAKPEVYTEEHEKLLGSTEKSWTLFVDGCGKDGKRIYDPVKGKTCHQCRQKTLGHRTHCCKCNMVQGQFCGDCLYMRYGEHVLEAQQNPNWICPVCRGICNCSLCRQAKGWLPTGPLYKKIARMGFKSVAHFLIQTRRSQPSLEQDCTDQVSAKRSLSFTDFEVIPAVSGKINDNFLETREHQLENNAGDEFENEKQNKLQGISNSETKDHISAKRSLNFPCLEEDSGEIEPLVLNHENDELRLSDLTDYEVGGDSGEKENELHRMKLKNDDNHCLFETCSLPDKKLTLAVETNTSLIAGRLIQEGGTGNDHRNKELSEVRGTALLTDQTLEKKTSGQTTSESTTGQRSLECGNSSDLSDGLQGVAEETSAFQQLSENKKLQISEQILDSKSGADPNSIYGRLRKRHKICDDHDGNESPTIYGKSIDVKQQNKEPAIDSKCRQDNIVGKMREKKSNRESKDDGISQESTSDEGVTSLSGEKAKATVKHSAPPEPTSESIGRRLRPRRTAT